MRTEATPRARRTTGERILAATAEVLARAGRRKLSLTDVAATAGVSRPTLYAWFPSKDALLEAFGAYEQQRFDDGLEAAIAGLVGEARLDAVLRFVVDFQHERSLARTAAIEPAFVLEQLTRALPTTRKRLEPHFDGPDAAVVAAVVTRVALSHALLPDPDPDVFLQELRTAAGVAREGHHGSSPRRHP